MASWISLDNAMDAIRKLAAEATANYESKPGADGESVMFPQLPASVYHADRDALSCSMIKPLLLSPAHYQVSLANTKPPSPAQNFGTLIHLLLLEPQRIGVELAVYPGVGDRRDREFKVFLESNSHRLAVDEPTFAQARQLVQKICSTRFRGRALVHFIEESMTECSVYFTEPTTGLRLRVRFDAYHPDFSFDLKTTRREDTAGFTSDAVDLGYDLQAYLYSLARRYFEGTGAAAPFVFIAAETSEPHSVCTHLAGETFLENGAAKLQECLATYKACTMVNHWPDLSCHTTLEIAHWQQFRPGFEWRAGLGSA
jgi:hypothetical protein